MNAMNGPHKYQLSQFEINFMRAHYKTMTNGSMAEILGLKLTLLRTSLYAMGLKKLELEYWTEEQVKFLKDHYKQYGDSELSEIFELKWKKQKGWDKKHIEKKRRYLELKRSPKENKEIKERNRLMGKWAVGNKKMWKTRGVAPTFEKRLWNSGGRGIMVIKVREGFVNYAHWLHEQIYGQVPDGMVVRLKDGNQENVTAANIELITRARNATLNSRSRLPAEWREIRALNQLLNKTIHERANSNKTAEPA